MDYGTNAASFILGRLGLLGNDNVYINVRIPGTKDLAENLHTTLPSGFTAEAYFNMLFAEGKQKTSISSLPAIINFFDDDLQVNTTNPRIINKDAQPAKKLALEKGNAVLSAEQQRALALADAQKRDLALVAEQQRALALADAQKRDLALVAEQQRAEANAAEQLRAEAVQKQKGAAVAAKQRVAEAKAAAEAQQRVANEKAAAAQAKAAAVEDAEEKILKAKQETETKQKNAQELKKKAEDEARKKDALLQKHLDAVAANKKAQEDLEKANKLAKEAKEANDALAAQNEAKLKAEGLDDAAKKEVADAALQQAEVLKQAEEQRQAAQSAADKAALEEQQALEALEAATAEQALEVAKAEQAAAEAAEAAAAAAAAAEEVAKAEKAQLAEEAEKAKAEVEQANANAEAAAEKAEAERLAEEAAAAEAAAEIQQLEAEAERLAGEAAEAERLAAILPDAAPLPPPKPTLPQPQPVVIGGQRYSNAELVTAFRVTNEVKDPEPKKHPDPKVDPPYTTKKITEYRLANWASNSCFFDGFFMIFLIHRNTFLFDALYYNASLDIKTNIREIIYNMDTKVKFNLGKQNRMDTCFLPPGVLSRNGAPDDSILWITEFLPNIFLPEEKKIEKQEQKKVSAANKAEQDAKKILKENPTAQKAYDDAKKIYDDAKKIYDDAVAKSEKAIKATAFLQQESSDVSDKECKNYLYAITIPVDHKNTPSDIDKISKIFNTADSTITNGLLCYRNKIQNFNFPIIFNKNVGGVNKELIFKDDEGKIIETILERTKTEKQVMPDEALIINNFIYELIGINTKYSPGHYVYFIKDPDKLTWYHYNDMNEKGELELIGTYASLIDHKLIKENTMDDESYYNEMHKYNKKLKQLRNAKASETEIAAHVATSQYIEQQSNSYTFIYYPNKAMVQHHKALNTLKAEFKQKLSGEEVTPKYVLVNTINSGDYLKLCCDIGKANANIIKQIHTSIPERLGTKFDATKFEQLLLQKDKADPVQSMIDQYGKKLAIYYTKKKGVIDNERWARLLRQCVLQETLCAFASTFDTMTYHEIAHYNMIRFKEKSQWKEIDKPVPTFGIIKVIKSDTLDAALSATKIFGESFTILNMANAIGFGGGYEDGRSAQEENIFRRTDCHFSMLRNNIGVGGKYDETKDSNGLIMEQRIKRGIVFKDQPRVCIRRGESLVLGVNKPPVDILQLIHYKWLDYYDIFQFYEMRNAAPDYRYKDDNPFYFVDKDKQGKDDNTKKDPIPDVKATILYNEIDKVIEAEADQAEIAKKALVKEIVSNMRIRIINQLTQLIENDCKYVILSAFGCGAFHNHPIVVSNLYNEIFESVYNKATNTTKTYRDHFKVIIFAIYQNNPNVDNSIQFQKLDNITSYLPKVQALFVELQALLTQLDLPDPSPSH